MAAATGFDPGDARAGGLLMLADVGAAELGPGLWRWTAYHEEWKHDVGCVAYEDGGELVLIDPLAPAGQRAARAFWRSLDREVADRARRVDVFVTLHWHERHAPEVAARYDAALWAPAAAAPRLTRAPDHAFESTDQLPAGIGAFATACPDEFVLWLPRARAIVSGDALLGGVRKPLRVCAQSWLPSGINRTAFVASLQPLLDLPVELVVPLHGEPIVADAGEILAQALA